MSRNIMSASSSSSAYLTGKRCTDGHVEFDIWNLINRKTQENAFCMTSKFRIGAKIHRISTTKVHRERHSIEDVKTVHDDVTSSSSSDCSQDWNDFDDEEDDLVDLYRMIQSKPTLSAAAGSIVTLTKSYNINRPFSGIESDVVSEISEKGTRAQKLYLKRCADFLITPSKIFLKALPAVVVDIAHQNIGPKGAEACAIALSQTRSVRVVNLNDNAIGHRGAKFMAMMLKENKQITELSLSDNNIGSRGVKYIVNILMENDTVQKLDLSNNGFKDKDAVLFKQLLEETRNLRYLNLSYNLLREEGGVLLGEALSYNDSLEELDLTWNHLRRQGATGVGEGIMDNTSLKKLTLGWNGFYLEGCIALQKSFLYNTTLEVLDLTNNRINRECIEQLTYGLAKNSTVHTLILKFNPLTSDGVNDVLQFLVDNPISGIKLLDVGIQQVDQNALALINEVHLQGRELKVIHGRVIGQLKSKGPELEKSLIEEHPALVLIEFGKLMGFRLVDLFSSLDKDGSRTLDRDEIRSGLKLANVPFSDDCIDILIKKLDINGDGVIDFSELLVAQQQHRDAIVRMKEAEQSEGAIRMEDTPLWRIRTRLMKLMAEKMSDYASFKRISDSIAKHVQKKNDELEARREAITKERARRPRKVRSRPTSSSQPIPVIKTTNTDKDPDVETSDNNHAHEDTEDVEVVDVEDDDVTGEVDIEIELADNNVKRGEQKPIKEEKSTMADVKERLRKHSIQLPVRSSDYLGLSSGKPCKDYSSWSIPEDAEKSKFN
ncbi:leucine-rich repeat-containing protein 74A-like [Ruditapes philippinarum]|uniref:leucine-rich repeat-containing protein 74A-like n=1 Tax=Ruditapes philippinarum TaxID=129788 RepID=UPI00295AA3ED|nr:leucine-rich repeat-containing protein 74A-like [Ruditapes philippinarum]